MKKDPMVKKLAKTFRVPYELLDTDHPLPPWKRLWWKLRSVQVRPWGSPDSWCIDVIRGGRVFDLRFVLQWRPITFHFIRFEPDKDQGRTVWKWPKREER